MCDPVPLLARGLILETYGHVAVALGSSFQESLSHWLSLECVATVISGTLSLSSLCQFAHCFEVRFLS